MRKLIVLISCAAALLFAGCDANRASMAHNEANLLGVVSYKEESYAATSPATVAIHTDELYTRKNFSGDQRTFLWGLITLKDY